MASGNRWVETTSIFDRSERHHLWAAEQVKELDAPLLVCACQQPQTVAAWALPAAIGIMPA
jgi:hypothetical protein